MGLGHELGKQLGCPSRGSILLVSQFGSKELLHELMKDNAAHGTGTRDLNLLRQRLGDDDGFEWIAQAISIVIARPAPRHGGGTRFYPSLFGVEHFDALLVWR